jgi:hypothetical protein
MTDPPDHTLLDALLDSWDRNNRILAGLLRLTPPDALDIRPLASSPSIGELFAHMHFVRLVFVSEDAAEFGRPLPAGEWAVERDVDRLLEMLQHLIWHEGYIIARSSSRSSWRAGRWRTTTPGRSRGTCGC